MGKLVKRQELSEILGVSIQTLITWSSQGVPIAQHNGHGRATMYDTEQVIKWLVERRAGKSGGAVEMEAKDEDLRLTRERADQLSIKNAILRREYMPISVAGVVISKICIQIGGILDTLPLNLKRKVPELDNTAIELIKREVVKTQNAIATADSILEQAIDEAFRGKSTAESTD